jgi:hypothetical protein
MRMKNPLHPGEIINDLCLAPLEENKSDRDIELLAYGIITQEA